MNRKKYLSEIYEPDDIVMVNNKTIKLVDYAGKETVWLKRTTWHISYEVTENQIRHATLEEKINYLVKLNFNV